MKPHELRNIIKSKRRFSQSISPMLEKVNTQSTPSRNIALDDNILTVIDKQHFGRTFSVETEGIYTVKLGAFHDLDEKAMEASALRCVIPGKSDYAQEILAMFYLPKSSAMFFDSLVLKAARPFRVKLVTGSPILECHHDNWGFPINYEHTENTEGISVITWEGFDKDSENLPKVYFDTLRLQIKILFEK